MDSFRMTHDPNRRKFITWLWQVVLLVAVYHIAVRLSLSMAYLQSNTSPAWPPTGIDLASLLLFGSSRWPGITFRVLLGSLLTGETFDISLGMSTGYTLEALMGAFVFQRTVDFHLSLKLTPRNGYFASGCPGWDVHKRT
jgi:integral membrane sensor domain MASE1